MENMRNKRSAAAVKGDKKVKRKLEAIKKYDRERELQNGTRKQKRRLVLIIEYVIFRKVFFSKKCYVLV